LNSSSYGCRTTTDYRVNPLSAKKSPRSQCQEVQSESGYASARLAFQLRPARASPSSFAVPYHFSISITGGFAFGHSAETCLHVVYIQHLTLKG